LPTIKYKCLASKLEFVPNTEFVYICRNWTLADICFKPPPPPTDAGALAALVTSLLDRIIPCIWITPIDCFWEGSKPLGPFPPINIA
jgi:hypothetical protein